MSKCFIEYTHLLTKIDEFPDCIEIVFVLALLGSIASEDVGEKSSVADLLFSHELNEITVLGIKASLFKLFHRKSRKPIME